MKKLEQRKDFRLIDLLNNSATDANFPNIQVLL